LEAAGVELAGQAIADADLLIAVREAGGTCNSVREESPPCGRRIDVWNKADLLSVEQQERIQERFAGCEGTYVLTSAQTGEGISALIEATGRLLVPHPPPAGAAVPFTAEQLAALEQARHAAARGDALSAQAALLPLLSH
jgi:tRNA U34 5-carboxymethylaminomethyl modifying GTPase MnmE/TrmE